MGELRMFWKKLPVHLEDLVFLLKLLDENPFKIRAFEQGAVVLKKLSFSKFQNCVQHQNFSSLSGIGKSLNQVILEFLKTGSSDLYQKLLQKIPLRVLELKSLKGLGPVRIRALMVHLGIQSISELEYACLENRLVHLSGFGKKTQETLLKSIAFWKEQRNLIRLKEATELSDQVRKQLQKMFPTSWEVLEAGVLRRKNEILNKLEFLVVGTGRALFEKKSALFKKTWKLQIPIEFFFSLPEEKGTRLFETTGTYAHLKACRYQQGREPSYAQEQTLYQTKGLEWIPPQCRESGEEVSLMRTGNFPELIEVQDLRGVFHVHTEFSDGTHSIEQMVQYACKRGWEYVGISDHSQSATYAHGLSLKRLKEQKKEIQRLQKKYPRIRIFWGIESDILKDGSLDYPNDILFEFDFVIASIHQRFQMNEQAMTKRILKAIAHPATTFLGHLTGRLLLGRPSYLLDIKKVLQACSLNGVVLELNAQPSRLDVSWNYAPLLRLHEVPIGIFPDAHALEDFGYVSFGVDMAKKALLSKKQVWNTQSRNEIESWLRYRKSKFKQF